MAACLQLSGWRVVAVALGAFAVAGCAGTGDPTNSDLGKVSLLLYHEITKIGADDDVPRERAAAIPYASVGVRLGSSSESMFVLANRSGHDLHWLGGKQLAITSRRGRIVQTVGFDHNLTGFEEVAGTPGADPSARDYLLDFAELPAYGVPVHCTQKDLGPESITIIGVAHETRHLAEDCNAPTLDWDFRNQFWADKSGFVWKSQQFVEPDLDPFTLEILRPAAQ